MSPQNGRDRRVGLGYVLALGVILGCEAPEALRPDETRSRDVLGQKAVDAETVAQLISMLESDDIVIRMRAIGRLEVLAGDRFEYDPAALPAARQAAIDQWLEWYDRWLAAREADDVKHV